MKKKILSYVAYLVAALPLGGVGGGFLASCNDYLDVDMKSEVERALNGVYAQALANDLYGDIYQRSFILNSDVDMQQSNANQHSHNTYARFD